MIVDTLTIAGFLSAASFLLMPLLMGREFVRVQATDEPQSASMATSGKRQSQHSLVNQNALRTSPVTNSI